MAQQARMAEIQQTFLHHLASTLKENVGARVVLVKLIQLQTSSARKALLRAQGITEFEYDPEANITFESWYSCYEGRFTEDAVNEST